MNTTLESKTNGWNRQLKIVRWGILLSTLAIFAGFFLGGLFGAVEDNLKGYLKAQGEQALVTVYENDKAKMDKVVSKSWVYFKRAHMHAGAIGSATLVLSILLAGLGGSNALKRVLASTMGLGAIGYSFFWLLAGMRAPGLGSTGAAKETLNWLAIPSAGALLLGVLLTIALSVYSFWFNKEEG